MTEASQVQASQVHDEFSREITTGLSADVAAVPAPPVPRLAEPWGLRLAEDDGADLDTVHRWMNLSHVAEFWDQAWSRARWQAHLRGQLTGTYSRPFLVTYEGSDFAYIELYRAARDVISAVYPALAYDVGYHVAIGDAERTGKGMGSRLFAAVIDGVFEAEPECRRIMSDPDYRNTGARTMDERLGFHFLGEFDLPHKRTALYTSVRTEADVPA